MMQAKYKRKDKFRRRGMLLARFEASRGNLLMTSRFRIDMCLYKGRLQCYDMSRRGRACEFPYSATLQGCNPLENGCSLWKIILAQAGLSKSEEKIETKFDRVIIERIYEESVIKGLGLLRSVSLGS